MIFFPSKATVKSATSLFQAEQEIAENKYLNTLTTIFLNSEKEEKRLAALVDIVENQRFEAHEEMRAAAEAIDSVHENKQ